MSGAGLREPKPVPIRCSECHRTRANVGDDGVCCEPGEANVHGRNVPLSTVGAAGELPASTWADDNRKRVEDRV